VLRICCEDISNKCTFVRYLCIDIYHIMIAKLLLALLFYNFLEMCIGILHDICINSVPYPIHQNMYFKRTVEILNLMSNRTIK